MALVRSGFVRKRTTLAQWCRKTGVVKRENARKALLGQWDGPKASAMRKRLIEAAGFTSETKK